jgi:pyruvate,orthophosphate dikinase
MQDMEFTIEHGKLFMLQTRKRKRTSQAALRIAVALVEEGLCTKKKRFKDRAEKSRQSLHPQFDAAALKAAKAVATGLAASPGAACGAICFTLRMQNKR